MGFRLTNILEQEHISKFLFCVKDSVLVFFGGKTIYIGKNRKCFNGDRLYWRYKRK